MYVEIHSKSEVDDESAGKSTWVNVALSKIEVFHSSPEHLNAPPWHIEITAEQRIQYSSGERSDGLGYRAVIRELHVQLTPADLSALLETALSSELLHLSVKSQGWISQE
jgi:hypothetical protein